MRAFRILAGVCEICTFIGALLAVFFLLSGIMPGNTAIQTAASSATAVAFVAIPYTVAGIFHRAAMRSLIDLGMER